MKNHYEVLGLQKNCSAEDIKNSFIKLSKLYHPDVNKSENAHKKFVQVNEAYSVLGKNESRIRYDSSLMNAREIPKYPSHASYDPNMNWSQYHYMHVHKMQSEFARAQPRPFFHRKLGAAIFCCFLVFVGTGIQLVRAANYRRRRSTMASMAYEQAKAKGKRIGREQAVLNFHDSLKAKERKKSFQEENIVDK